jgi:hypothetical protein
LTRKQVDDIMGGEDAWKNVDSTEGETETISIAVPSDTYLARSSSRSRLSEMRERKSILLSTADPICR